jgi:hypothetical protein
LPLQQPGAVLFWKDSDPSSGANNTLVVGLGEHVQSGDCFQPIACPFAIAVGPDSALVFTGLDNLGQGNRVSPWGAVNVPLGSTVINVAGAQGRSEDWDEASSVAVVDPASLHVVFSGNGDNYNFSGSDLTGSSFAGLVRAAVPEPAQLRLRHARR